MLNPFPFSESEWGRVSEVAAEVTNATLMDDEVLAASKLADLQVVLGSLREMHGDHPVLLETEADFLLDPGQSCQLYLQAIDGAMRGSIPSYTVRLSLAALMLDELNDREAARTQLLACEVETTEVGDSWEQARWAELLRRCSS
jgi:hypothetical protein